MEATQRAREYIRNNRKKWLNEDIDVVYEMYKKGEIDKLDLIRRYGVIVDFKNDTVLKKSTQQFREMLQKRSVAYWD